MTALEGRLLMLVIMAGSIGRLPLGGHAWADMQVMLGLRALGHDVYYLEECGPQSWVYDWEHQENTCELTYPAGYVRACLEPFGLGDCWIYRAGDEAAGMQCDRFDDLCAQADLLIVRAAPMPQWRPAYLRTRRRAFIDADPGFTQDALVRGKPDMVETVQHCDVLFTLAQRIGRPDCTIAHTGRPWIAMPPPVCLDHWPVQEAPGDGFSTVMQWRSYDKVSHDSAELGNKDRTFPPFLPMPQRTGQRFTIALTGGDADRLSRHGWTVLPGWEPSRTPQTYQQFIQQSRAEFSVAKHGYVATRGGWFSDRSVCYLASGRPVVVHDTGLGDWLPVGEGALVFSDLDSACRAVQQVVACYPEQSRAARRLAEQCFDARRVMHRFLEAAAA